MWSIMMFLISKLISWWSVDDGVIYFCEIVKRKCEKLSIQLGRKLSSSKHLTRDEQVWPQYISSNYVEYSNEVVIFFIIQHMFYKGIRNSIINMKNWLIKQNFFYSFMFISYFAVALDITIYTEMQCTLSVCNFF